MEENFDRPRPPGGPWIFAMPTRRLLILGRVQGVGFRYGLCTEAERLGVRGWVRNRRDGGVEALVQGDGASLDAIARWAAQGPPLAKVTELRSEPVDQAEEMPGFRLLPTA